MDFASAGAKPLRQKFRQHNHNYKNHPCNGFFAPARVICLLQLREIGSAVIRIVRNLRAQ